MTQNEKLEKFAKLVSDKPSNFLAKLEYYETNKKWLENSSRVAVNVLEILKEKNWSQRDLANKMNVSAQQINKIIKGQQNLTFETIGKLEDTLGISLIEIVPYKPTSEIMINNAIVQAVKRTISDEISIDHVEPISYSKKFVKKHVAKMDVVFNVNKQIINYKPSKQAV